MSTDKTPHYGLHQWAPEDAFLRAEFNENTEKTDTAIQEVADYAKANRNALEPMGYNLYDMILQKYYEGKYTGFRRGLIFDGLLNDENIESMTGGMRLDTDGLRLDGPNAIGTMTRKSTGTPWPWARAVCWIRYNTGVLKPIINGKEMVHWDIGSSITPNGGHCLERVFRLEEPGITSIRFALQVDTLTNAMVKIYNYGVMFL